MTVHIGMLRDMLWDGPTSDCRRCVKSSTANDQAHRLRPVGQRELQPTVARRSTDRPATMVRFGNRRPSSRISAASKRVTAHAFRHSFAAHLLADGDDIRTVQELLDHKDVRTTMIHTHVLNRRGRGIRSLKDGPAQRPDDRRTETLQHEQVKTLTRGRPVG